MKSFKQFLDENYLSEEEVQGRLLNRKNQAYKDINNPNPGNRAYSTDPTAVPASKRLSAGASAEKPKVSPGQLNIPEPKKTKVPGSSIKGSGEMRQGSLLTKGGKAQNFTGGRTPFVATEPVKAIKKLSAAAPTPPKVSPGQQEIRQTSKPPTTKALPSAGGTGGVDKQAQLRQIAAERQAKRSAEQSAKATKTGSLVKATPSGLTAPVGSKSNPQQIRTNMNVPGGKTPKMPKMPKGVGKWAGRGLAALGASADTADEYKAQRSKGRSRKSSLGMGVTKAAGGLAGAQAGASSGAALGATVGSVVPGAGTAVGGLVGGVAGGIGGYYAGSKLAGKASEVTAGATGREKKAMATANRQRQAGTAVKGIGGNTTFSQKKPGGPAFMSTGVGKQRSTVQLGKTGVVQRGGQSVAGHLAFKGGKAVYKAGPSAQSLAKTSSNPLERIGRTIAPGAYKKHDAAKAKQALTKATQSDISRGQKLGVKYKPGG